MSLPTLYKKTSTDAAPEGVMVQIVRSPFGVLVGLIAVIFALAILTGEPTTPNGDHTPTSTTQPLMTTQAVCCAVTATIEP